MRPRQHRGLQRRHVFKVGGLGVGSGAALGQIAQGEQAFNALRLCMLAHLGMKGSAIHTHLAHVTQHQ